MPSRILPHLTALSQQISGIVAHYRRSLDDEFLFGSAAQIPQVATIFDRVGERPLHFSGENLSLTDLLTLIAFRYGFERVRVVGHGGYAVVLGNAETSTTPPQRRVLRLVPEHHVRDIVASGDSPREFDVRLDATGEPLRDPAYPLLLSDLLLLPRHTTRLVFHDATGTVVQAGGYPAVLHCQLLPEVRAFNGARLEQARTRAAGDLLEAALATVGVSVADAHGGNGGVLVGSDGQPITYDTPDRPYIPVVLDYGYYSAISPRALAGLLRRYDVTPAAVRARLAAHRPDMEADDLADLIDRSGLPRSWFGRLLLDSAAAKLNPALWIDRAEDQWRTIKERTYPPLQAQARLSRLYPDYDEVLFPQRIETYHFTV